MRLAVFLVLFLLGASRVQADNTPPSPKPNAPSSSPTKPDNRPSFTPEREAAALAFVNAHHPELRHVLDQLKAMEHREYESAIRQLFQTSEQLAKVKDTDERRYDIEVEEWKAKSRIQLLLARAGVTEDPGIEAQLKDLLTRQSDLKIAKLDLERVRAAERVTKLDYQITKARNERLPEVEKQLVHLMRNVDKARAEFKKRSAKLEKKK